MNWPQQLELFEQDVTGTPPIGRLVVADEGTEVYLDMYPAGLDRMRIKVTREALRIYAQKLLEAANRPTNG